MEIGSPSALPTMDVCRLFGGLLVPPLNADDVERGSTSPGKHYTQQQPRHQQYRTFVVNREAGRDLCAHLEPRIFMALPEATQAQVMSMMLAGLRAGICSAIRLRLSCEGDDLTWRLLDLLTELAAARIEGTGTHGGGQDGVTRDGGGVIPVLGQVLGMVGSAGVGVDELKGILRALRVPSAITPPLVEALAVMASPSDSSARQRFARPEPVKDPCCPPAVRRMFNFDGKGAGLVLPAVSWPFAQEYQIAAWVRVEPSAAGSASYETKAHLVTFTSHTGAGVDYYIEASRLFVVVGEGRASGDVQPREVDVGEVGFVCGRWHALVIWHKKSNALRFSKDHLEVFLDGELVYSAPVPYPRHVGAANLTRCSVGWDFDGQMSGVLFFSGAANLKVVTSMLKRLTGQGGDSGKDAPASASDPDLWADPATVSSQERIKTNLFGGKHRIFAAYLPGRTTSRQCLEPHNGLHASLRGDRTHAWVARAAQDVVRSVGGTPTLLPMAHHLLSDAPSQQACPTAGQNVDTVLSVLLSFLDGNVANQLDFFRAGGVEILELLIHSSPRGNFACAGAHTVMTLEGIFYTCWLRPVSIASSDDDHHLKAGAQQVLVCLVANFPLWARAPPEFLLGLATSVLDIVREMPELFRRLVSVEKALASIRICCPDRTHAETCQVLGTESETPDPSSPKHPATTSLEDRRERLHMRGFLWEVVRHLVKQEMSQEDGDAFVQFMASCDDTRLVCELVQMLGSLMRQIVPPAGLYRTLENASLAFQDTGRGRRASKPESPSAGFLALVLHRCVLAGGVSETLRVAGLRAANVFMARSAKAHGHDTLDWRGSQDIEMRAGAAPFVKAGDSMHSKVSSVFPLLSGGLMRDGHALGESTYAALLEMALLADEREVPWSEQLHVMGIVYASKNARAARLGSYASEWGEGNRPGGESAQDEELAASVWWNCEQRYTESGSGDGGAGNGQVLDDAQLIRNALPLALILQYLPIMASSVQVRSQRDLMLMLKLNETNRRKLLELSHADGDKFWGVWERSLFLMMAPLFSRHAEVDVLGGKVGDDDARKGDYLMVLKLYAILLEHTMSLDGKGYKEVALAASLQPLIPHGRIATRVLLAQLAFEVGQKQAPLLPADLPGDDTAVEYADEVEGRQQQHQLRWNNMVHLAFIAANVVSDDMSTIAAGLFPEKADEEPTVASDGEAMRASAASVSIPFLLCSNPAVHGSVALSARVLSMFGVLTGESPSAVLELAAACTMIPGQGPLMFPLLRLSLFLLVRLHPFSKPAQQNVSRLASLVECLASSRWDEKTGSHCVDNDDMCIVVLAHVHAALLRLKSRAMTIGGVSHKLLAEARDAVAGGETLAHSVVGHPALDPMVACEVGHTLLGLLRCLARRRMDLLGNILGEQLTSALQGTIDLDESGGHPASMNGGSNQQCWESLLQSLQWMERSDSLFACAKDSRQGGPELLQACMPSLKAAEELESRAVQAGGERAQEWQDLVKRTAVAEPAGVGSSDGSGKKVVEALRRETLRAEALRRMEMERRLLTARRWLQRCMQTLSAAWSPWAPGNRRRGGNDPPGWEVSCHKDQQMRQMLLVPIDRDVGHKDASYRGTNAAVESEPQPTAPDGDASLLPAFKPSASLLAGEVGFIDDDEEEEGGAGGVEGGSARDEREREHSSWGDISDTVVLQAEIEEPTQPNASQLVDCDEPQPIPVSLSWPQPGNGRTFQGLRGKWGATNVLREGSVPGTLYLFDETLVFQSDPCANEGSSREANPTWPMEHGGQSWRWRLTRLTQLHLRRFLLSPQAVELFWADSPEVFLAFQDVNDRQAFTRTLRKRNLPMLPAITQRGTLHPTKVLKASKLTELWRRRQISTFQYIMQLNVVAGRSYNDITQYPVFPWVLSDYTSNELDLNDPASFRDLSKPMGAVDERRKEAFMERYASFEDDNVPKFMYGSHYSSAGVVLYYHVRQDPFTTQHINLQGGRFDCPDRLFEDVGQCWLGCIDRNNLSDVKELTPEFFYFPEMFLNSNKLPLGDMQGDRGAVDDVRLPPWAKDAFDFVRIHRLALESEQVSKHLHHWIDLVFGFKQRGTEAVKAANVFYYLTYEGAVDLSQVNDARQRDAMEAQIRHFGQTPSQLLLEPHPVRLPPEECVLPLFSPTSTLASLRAFSATHKPRGSRHTAAALVYCTDDRLVCVDESLRVTTWAWSGIPNGQGLPFTLGTCRNSVVSSRSLHMSYFSTKTPVPSLRSAGSDLDAVPQRGRPWIPMASIGWGWATNKPAASASAIEDVAPCTPARSVGCAHSYLGLRTASEGYPESIISCGYWDHAVRLHFLDYSANLPLGGSGSGGHRDQITCLCIADGGSLLVTGGQDATCRVWVVGNAPMAVALGGSRDDRGRATDGESSGSYKVCVHVLYGHEAPVTCLAVSEELDAVVSGASDGRIVQHCLKDGRYVRQYFCSPEAADCAGSPTPEANQLAFSCQGDVVAHSWTDLSLHRFSLNGARLANASAPTAMSCLLTAGGGEYLLAGGNDGLIRVYALHDLSVVHAIDLQDHGGVTCMRLSPNDEYLLAASEDGEVSIITDARKRMRMLDLALRRAFVG